jgi:hypothetical protein
MPETIYHERNDFDFVDRLKLICKFSLQNQGEFGEVRPTPGLARILTRLHEVIHERAKLQEIEIFKLSPSKVEELARLGLDIRGVAPFAKITDLYRIHPLGREVGHYGEVFLADLDPAGELSLKGLRLLSARVENNAGLQREPSFYFCLMTGTDFLYTFMGRGTSEPLSSS